MHWNCYKGELKWAVVIQNFDAKNASQIDLLIGERVYIRRHCKDWFYGFKATGPCVCGAFPKICVLFPTISTAAATLPELPAELGFMFSAMLSKFSCDAISVDKIMNALNKVAELRGTLDNKVTKHEARINIESLLKHIAIGKKELDVPFLIRNDDFSLVDIYSESLINLHKSYQKQSRQNDPSHPVSQLFDVRIQFACLPQAELSIYLVSQMITAVEDGSSSAFTSGGIYNSATPTVIRAEHSDHQSYPTPPVLPTDFQLTTNLRRLTETVVLDGYHNASDEVIFTELDPLDPRQERLLLMICVNRFGPMQMKRARGSSGPNIGSKQPRSQIDSGPPSSILKRPIGVACVDITRDVVPYQGYVHTTLDSPSRNSANTLGQCPNRCGKLISTTLTGEQFQIDALHQLAMTRDATTNHSCSTSYTNNLQLSVPNLVLANEQPAADNYDFKIKCIEVLNPLQSQLFTRNSIGTLCHHGRRYGFARLQSNQMARREVYINLLSADFSRGSKKQERNVEVEVSLRDLRGNLSSAYNSCASFPISTFVSTVYYHKNHPKWHEVFAVPLPPSNAAPSSSAAQIGQNDTTAHQSGAELVPGSLAGDHLRFVCLHKSTALPSNKHKLIGVAYLRLQPHNSLPVSLENGTYHLIVHKMDQHQIDLCAYLREDSYLSNPEDAPSGLFSPLTKHRRETLTIQTLLCSTEHTTDINLTKVIFWQKHSDDLITCLRKGICQSKNDCELRKFKRPIWKSLIEILNSMAISVSKDEPLQVAIPSDLTLGFEVISALAHSFGDLPNNLIYQDLFQSYLLSAEFTYTHVHQPYLYLLNSMIQHHCPLPTDQIDPICHSPTGALRRFAVAEATVKIIFDRIYWAFLIIIRSRELELEQNRQSPSDAFIQQVNIFFEHMFKVIWMDSKSLLTSILIKHVPEIFRHLDTVYPLSKLAVFVDRFLRRTLDNCVVRSLKIINETIQSNLFASVQTRQTLLPTISHILLTCFSNLLDKELVVDRVEMDMLMECWCNTLLLFVSRLFELDRGPLLVNGDQPEPHTSKLSPELMRFLVAGNGEGLVRWTMHQLGRLILFVTRKESSVPATNSVAYPLYGLDSATESTRPTIGRLQPVVACLTSVLMTLLQNLDESAWLHILRPVQSESLSCQCATCVSLQIVDLYDFVHELLNLFKHLHSYPAYPAPVRQRSRTPILCGGAAVVGALTKQHTNKLSGLATSWLGLLVSTSKIELQILNSIVNLGLKPIMDSMQSRQSPGFILLRANHRLCQDLIGHLQQCLGSFVTDQPHLCMEGLPVIARTQLACNNLERTESDEFSQIDLRQVACQQLSNLWHLIDDAHKESYIPVFLPTLIDMATVPFEPLRNICVGLIFDAIRVNRVAVERDFMGEVDRVMQRAGTEFATDLCSALEEALDTSAAATTTGGSGLDLNQRNLVVDLIKQINMLLTYGEFFNHPSKLSELLALRHLYLMYERLGRKDMTLRYLYRLESLHAACGNVLEQGYTLEAISKQYAWSDELIDQSNIPVQYVSHTDKLTSSTLREQLLSESIKCLRKGTDWEHAIEVCDCLVEFHRTVQPNFTKLSAILREQGDLYDYIMDSRAPRIPYFHYPICFSGPPLASFLTGCFVYRTTLQSADLMRMLRDEFPHVNVINQPSTSGGADTSADFPVIIVSGSLTPQPSLPKWLEDSHGVDYKIKSYYLQNHVSCFTRIEHLKPIATADGRELRSARETRYVVSEPLPNMTPIVSVLRQVRSSLGPAQLASHLVQSMIKNIQAHLSVMSDGKPSAQFVSNLTTSIYSPVSGGLPKLIEGIELSDDAVQEVHFANLSDSVLELLELQMVGLEFWYQTDPPVGSTADDANRAELMASMVDLYATLTRDMSRKFGFAVDHLSVDHLHRHAQTFKGVELRRESNPSGSYRSFHRPMANCQLTDWTGMTATLIKSKSPSLRGKTTYGSCFGEDDQDPITFLMSTNAPPLPERPANMKKPTDTEYLLSANLSGSERSSPLGINRMNARPPRWGISPESSSETTLSRRDQDNLHDNAPPVPPRNIPHIR